MTLPVLSPTGRPQIMGFAEYLRTRPVSDAQVAPGATTVTTLLTVPAGYWYEGRVWVTNRGAACTIRIAARLDGIALANKHYLAYDEPLAVNESLHTEMLYLPAGAVVAVYASTGDTSFSFVGLQREVDVNF